MRTRFTFRKTNANDNFGTDPTVTSTSSATTSALTTVTDVITTLIGGRR